ncbi:hypothetical protein [Methylobacterium sp. 1973]|uniref:hypothetical protein n=1 Tax=Methylobacterium sp. 1973 TaxID=3156421 RepID=UPI0033939C6A
MPSRRSVLAFLGLAPVAAPAAIAAAARPEVLVAGCDIGNAGGEVGVFAVTPGGLRAVLLGDLRHANLRQLQDVSALLQAAGIEPGRWIPFASGGDA